MRYRADTGESGGGPHDAAATIHPVGQDLVPDIARLTDMFRGLSAATEPYGVVDTYLGAVAKAHGHDAVMVLSTEGLPAGRFRVTRFFDGEGRDQTGGLDPYRERHRIPVATGGFVGQCVRSPEVQLYHGLAVRGDPVFGDALAGFGSAVVLPVFERGEPVTWAIVFRARADGYAPTEVEGLLLRANLVGTAMANVGTARDLREADAWIQHEVDTIAELQAALRPTHLPAISGVTLAASLASYDRAGGDLYDVYRLSEHADRGAPEDPRWAILVADVSGHGPAGAVMAAMLQSIIHAWRGAPSGPGELLTWANAQLCARRIETGFVTALLAFYDPAARALTCSNAGHPAPLVRRGATGAVEAPSGPVGIPLGLVGERAVYTDQTVRLAAGDTVLLFTDGIVEAPDPQRRRFGVERLRSTLAQIAPPASQTVSAVQAAVRAFEGGAHPEDDQTILALAVDPGA